jgi:hypothetical protein
MDNNIAEMKENVLAGTVGAVLFSLVGGILWFVLYQIGYLAAISGLIGIICAIKGYTFFAKTKDESKLCLIISSIASVVVLAISWYLCVGYDIYLVHQEWYETGETDYTLTYFESIRAIPFYFTTQREVLFAYLKDLAIGLVFAALGVVSYLSSREKKRKRLAEEAAAKAEAERAAAEAAAFEAEENEYAKDSE